MRSTEERTADIQARWEAELAQMEASQSVALRLMDAFQVRRRANLRHIEHSERFLARMRNVVNGAD